MDNPFTCECGKIMKFTGLTTICFGCGKVIKTIIPDGIILTVDYYENEKT